MNGIEIFKEENPTLESYWRSVILFGRNVASYKFALAKSLLELVQKERTEITLEELAIPYSKYLCEHLRVAPKQTTSNSSKFLEACSNFNNGLISYDELISVTTKLGFSNVIDAFHVVNQGILPIKFYEKDYAPRSKKIILTDNIFELQLIKNFEDLMVEAESRWNLVESSWELGVSRNVLNIKYDGNIKSLFVDEGRIRRKDITSARGALNGYQKGKCFYCFDDIAIDSVSSEICDIDHFFPHKLQELRPDINFDGVWNLVLTCTECNRGKDGKFMKIPSLHYLERLHKRNEFLISSHHPLRETLMNQTGKTEDQRVNFLKSIDSFAMNMLIHRWKTENRGKVCF